MGPIYVVKIDQGGREDRLSTHLKDSQHSRGTCSDRAEIVGYLDSESISRPDEPGECSQGMWVRCWRDEEREGG